MKFDAMVFVGYWNDELLSACFSKEKYTKEQVVDAFPKLWQTGVVEEWLKFDRTSTKVEAVPFSEQTVFRMPAIQDIKESEVFYQLGNHSGYYSDPMKPKKNGFKTWAIYFNDILINKEVQK